MKFNIIENFRKENYFNKIILIAFVLIIGSDFFMKLNNYTNVFPVFRYSGIVKLLFEFFIIVVAFKKGINKQSIYLIGVLIASFFIGQLFLTKNSILSGPLLDEVLRGDIYHLNKYIFIILFISVIEDHKDRVKLSKMVVNMVLLVLSINSLLILCGFLFNVDIFQSFPGSKRFGYSGLFIKSGESVLLYLLASIYFYIKFLKGKSIWPVIYFCIVALLSGKKIAILILPLFYIVHFCFQSRFKQFYRVFGILGLTSILMFKNVILEYTVKLFPFWEVLLKERGFWTVIFSTRDLNFYKTFNFIVEYWTPLNYLFGGTNYNQLRIEIDPFDLFVFLGLVGLILYLLFVKNKYLAPIKNNTINYLVVGFLIIGMIYGAFLFNILLMTILYLFVILFSTYQLKEND